MIVALPGFFSYIVLMPDRKTGYSPLNAENYQGVTNEVMFAYAHEQINIYILLSVLRTFSFFFMILT